MAGPAMGPQPCIEMQEVKKTVKPCSLKNSSGFMVKTFTKSNSNANAAFSSSSSWRHRLFEQDVRAGLAKKHCFSCKRLWFSMGVLHERIAAKFPGKPISIQGATRSIHDDQAKPSTVFPGPLRLAQTSLLSNLM
jgi:hypothetical protein